MGKYLVKSFGRSLAGWVALGVGGIRIVIYVDVVVVDVLDDGDVFGP